MTLYANSIPFPSTFFLVNPLTQLKTMFDPSDVSKMIIKICCAITIFVMMVLAFCAAFWVCRVRYIYLVVRYGVISKVPFNQPFQHDIIVHACNNNLLGHADISNYRSTSMTSKHSSLVKFTHLALPLIARFDL